MKMKSKKKSIICFILMNLVMFYLHIIGELSIFQWLNLMFLAGIIDEVINIRKGMREVK